MNKLELGFSSSFVIRFWPDPGLELGNGEWAKIEHRKQKGINCWYWENVCQLLKRKGSPLKVGLPKQKQSSAQNSVGKISLGKQVRKERQKRPN